MRMIKIQPQHRKILRKLEELGVKFEPGSYFLEWKRGNVKIEKWSMRKWILFFNKEGKRLGFETKSLKDALELAYMMLS